MDVLALNNITKYYGRILALDNVSFNVPAGSVFGILGPNGSGKTTMLGIIMNILKATSGTFQINGQAATADVRKHIGTLLETPNFYHYLSAERNLRIAAEIKGKPDADINGALKRVNLYERRASKFSTYSLGMKQRLAIASCLLGDPDILIFDEPTNGLDPVGIAEIRDLIRMLAGEGKTIIMASHLLDEVEKVCNHVAILKYGKLITAGDVNEVLKNEDIVEVAAADMQKLENVITTMGGYSSYKQVQHALQIFYPMGTANMEGINRACFNNGVVLSQLQLKKKSLETKFLELTGN